MANLTKTLAIQTLDVFGPAPATQWGTGTHRAMTWGSSKWGEGTQTILLQIGKNLAGHSITPTDAITHSLEYMRAMSFAVSPDFAMISGAMTDQGGYQYVFPGPSTNPFNQSGSAYALESDGSITWASQTAASTTWSDS